MDAGIEKECSALGGLFQVIMNDMKVRTRRSASKKQLLRPGLVAFSDLVEVSVCFPRAASLWFVSITNVINLPE